jgi:hypothetical protein
MSAHPPAPPELNPDDPVGARYPNTARIWNYHLGGKDNFRIDQKAADAVNAMAGDIGVPSARDAANEGRHLLQRMVDYMLAQGVRQFLDLGSGFPNMANTHQIAHRVDPDARVVYVDLDPVVSTHAAALMASPNVITLNADLRQPEQVLGDAQVGAARLRPARRHHVHLRAALPVERGGPVGDRAAVPGHGGAGKSSGDQPHDRRGASAGGRTALPDDPGPALQHAAHIAAPG